MSWLEKLLPTKIRTTGEKKQGVPEGLWKKCDSCQAVLFAAEVERNLYVCPKCGHHLVISARQRIAGFLDPETEAEQVELGSEFETVDKLKFRDSKRYKDRLVAAQKKTDESDAAIVMKGKLKGQPIVIFVMDFAFMGGSMGSVVGQRFTKAAEVALEEKIPFVCFSASGGARMQEGLLSLLQMAKTSAALQRLAERSIPYISVLTHPTTGGVTASFSMLGDVNIAEPNALIGFAGPRVIEQTVGETLPEGFQRSEFLLDHGSVDIIVERGEMRDTIARLLAKLMHYPVAA